MSHVNDQALPSIAIIGMAGRFPGAADIEEFWRNLKAGVESISTFSPDELEPSGEGARRSRDPRYVPRRGVVDGADRFDAAFFGYTRRQAELTDPQQRLFLECAWEALEHAGYDPGRHPDPIGVFGGAGFNHYLVSNLLGNRTVVDQSGLLQTSIRNRTDHLATMVAYHLDLRGPAVTVQTACSTSLVAVHMACQSLLDHECDLALAGGASVTVPQRSGYVHQEGGILSTDGSCRAFDASATGTVSGDGAGVVVLKRLDQALADRDTIHGVILGSAIGNDGAGKVGYTAPSVEGQARVVAEAYAVAGVHVGSVGLIEAHGTGTAMGDPIEVAALNDAFAAIADRPRSCPIGSVKSNIGHLDAAAGVAGLIKTVLSVKHAELPPSLHFERPNPEVPFAAGPFFVNAERRDWPAGQVRRGGVSSFGIGGTNAHVIVEEPPGVEAGTASRPHQLLLLSARTSTALEAATARLADALVADPGLDLADLAYTLQVGRAQLDHRRMVICRDRDEALRALQTLDPRLSRTGFHQAKERPVVFMFPGQGAQHVHMARDLYQHEPTFRRVLDACALQLEPHLGCLLTEIIYPAEGAEEAAAARLGQTEVTQPALFAVEYALATLLLEWGLEPRAMIGHSIGEYVAACLAGVLTLEDALELVAVRGRIMQAAPRGAMLVVPMTEAAAAELAAARGLSLAAVNGPESCVVSGPIDVIDRLEAELGAAGAAIRRVATSHAFHSSMLDPVMDELRAACARVRLQPPVRPYLSNVTGTWITAEQATDPGYWVRHLRETVRFADGVGALVADPDTILLEVGPGRTLSTFARWNPTRAAGQVVLNAMRHPSDAVRDDAFLLGALGRFWMTGGSIDAAGFYRDEQRRRVPLPTYPFERQRCWIEPLPASGPTAGAGTGPLEKRVDMDAWFYAPSWRRTPAPLATSPAPAPAGGAWLLFADRHGLADAVADELERRGIRAIRVASGAVASGGGDRRAIRALEPADYDELLSDLQDGGAWPSRILHLWNVTDGRAAASAEASFLAPMYLAQALGRRGAHAPVELLFVTNHLQEVTGHELVQPERATMLGPCRVIPQEYPQVSCRHVDVDLVAGRRPDPALVAALVAEAGAEDREVAHRGGHRWVRSFEPLPLPGPEAFRPRPDSVTLITGGLGGIGLVLAEELARVGGARLVLVGRRGLPPREDRAAWVAAHGEEEETSRRIRAVERLEDLGAQVLVAAADVSDRAAMAAAVAAGRARFGEITGVIHAAGVAGGGLIALRTADAARSVLAPKVAGTLVLDELFRDTSLDLFALCSSRSSILGGTGQIDYAAANAFLDAFAASTRSGGRNLAVSIDWDAWRDVGMLSDKAAAHGVGRPAAARPLDHLLFDGHVREADGTDVYTTVLSPLSHWILDEHRIVGNAVMPGTGYLEMARAAAQGEAGDRLVEIRDAFFLAPLGLRDDEEREVKTAIKRLPGGGLGFRVTSKPPDEWEWKEYSSGRIAFVPRTDRPRHDLQAIIDRCTLRRVVMNDDTPRDEDLGPRWQALKVAWVGGDEHLARLELPVEFAGELASLRLHPSLLDRATGTGKEFLIKEGIYLPMGYRRLTIHRPLERVIYVHVRFRPEVDPTGQTITFDVVFMNEAGDELVDIEAFAQKRINDIAGQIRVFANRQYGRREARSGRPAGGALADHYADQLQQGISPAEGAAAFRRIAAAAGPAQVVVSTRDLHASIAQADRQRPSDLVGEAGAARASMPGAGSLVAAGDVEQQLAEVWRRVLGADKVDVHDNFFDLGGDSIQAIQIVAQINELGFGLTAQQLFQHQTVADLARALGATGAVAVTPPEAAPPEAAPPEAAPPEAARRPSAAEPPAVVAEPAGARAESPRKPDRPMEFGLFFFADSSDASDKYRLYLDSARFADRHGFSAVWTPERHFHAKGGLYPNPSVLSSALAVMTQHIQLRAGSVVMPLHDPLRVAEEWSVVDNLSRGRVQLSFVSGWVPNDFAFFPDRYANKRAEMFRGIEHVQRLWRGESIETRDGAGNLAEIRIFPRPVQPELPTWLTCSGSRDMFVKAGQLGFHVLTSLQQQTMESLTENLDAYRRARAEAGFEPSTGKVAVMMHTFLGPDKEGVLAKVRGPLSSYLRSHLDLIKTFTTSLDIEAGLDEPERIDAIVQFAFERYHRTASLIGTPRDCRAMVARLKAIGVSEVACLIDFGVDVDSTLASLGYLDELRRQEQSQPAGPRGPAVQVEAH